MANKSRQFEMAQGADAKNGAVNETERFMSTLQVTERAINQYFQNPDITFTYDSGQGFYIDLEELRVNLDPHFQTELGFAESEVVFGAFHEAEHFRDMMQNVGAYKKRRAIIKGVEKEDKRYAAALHRLHNIVDDVMVNTTVAGRWQFKDKQMLKNMYHKLFPGTDYTKSPKYSQFANALIRELMIPDERCEVAPDVREAIDKVSDLVAYISRFNISKQAAEMDPDQRIAIIRQHIEPLYKKFWEEATEKEKNQAKQRGKEGEKGENDEKGEKGENDEKGEKGEPGGEDALDQIDHDDLLDQIDAINRRIVEKQKEKARELLGFDPQEAARYRREFEQYIRPNLDGMVEFFKSFVQERLKLLRVKKISSRGETIPGYLLNEAYIQAESGQLDNAPVFERKVVKEKREEFFTDFELTLMIDGSGSMVGNAKEAAQRRAVLLIAEAINAFQLEVNDLEEAGEPIKMSLKTQIREFADSDNLIKDFDEELDMPERIGLSKRLRKLSGGSNNEIASFQEIQRDVAAKAKELSEGSLRKLIIVITDGESDESAIKAKIKEIYRVAGNVPNFKIIGVGMGDETPQVNETYAPNGHGQVSLEALAPLLAQELEEFISFEVKG